MKHGCLRHILAIVKNDGAGTGHPAEKGREVMAGKSADTGAQFRAEERKGPRPSFSEAACRFPHVIEEGCRVTIILINSVPESGDAP